MQVASSEGENQVSAGVHGQLLGMEMRVAAYGPEDDGDQLLADLK